MFGNWIKHENRQNLRDTFLNNKPYEHIVIENFFRDDYADLISNNLPYPDSTWVEYFNPIEYKYTYNKISELDQNTHIPECFDLLNSNEFIDVIKDITNIQDLEKDDYLHGAGLHFYPSNGKLDAHLDYCIHPITGMERRLNLIIYLNNRFVFQPDSFGFLKLYSEDLSSSKTLNCSMWNTAVLFRTSDISYHGIPDPIKIPPSEYRKSLAVYYVSKPRSESTRKKAQFVSVPGQYTLEDEIKMKELYKIRVNRILTKEDCDFYFPKWKSTIFLHDIKNPLSIENGK